MLNSRHPRNSIFDLSFGAATIALAIMLVLIAVATQPALGQTFTVLHNFSGGEDGASPYAGVTIDRGGNLYGTASAGGIGYGTVYKLTNRVWTLNPLYKFTGGSDGASPYARVVFGQNGTLYGTTYGCNDYNCGTVFNLRPPARACPTPICLWTETVLYSFTGYGDGDHPEYGDLLFKGGNIFGTTGNGGNGYGVVYELTPSGNGWTESVPYAFSGSDGAYPYNGVISDNGGNLYGTTYEGGLRSYGTAFELLYPGWAQQYTLNNFGDDDGGDLLYAGLIFDQVGNLYGATSDAGSGGGGTVFELTPCGEGCWTLQTLYSFMGTFNANCGPWGTLFMDVAGNFYGTTYCDGSHGFGNVFELTPQNGNWIYTDLHDFTGGSDGGNPISTVVMDASGNLYGTASTGGSQGVGVVWEITP